MSRTGGHRAGDAYGRWPPAHDPEKWKPVFGQGHAPTKDVERRRAPARLPLRRGPAPSETGARPAGRGGDAPLAPPGALLALLSFFWKERKKGTASPDAAKSRDENVCVVLFDSVNQEKVADRCRTQRMIALAGLI